ncbi:DNA primase [Bifidobacterium anseris]|uniref:DNA primase n=1 Tax=Bifidobacterium anseris TaxID=2020963 RepID=A0A2N5J2U2_9BIFI|nr:MULTISPECIES: DNA primase [Bifidobacterium]PLS28541.1 DNA primase [Bifidobacterium anseris]
MAGLIRQEDIDKVRNAADLYDIVSASVSLKPAGVGSFSGLCPFHDEKTPSFYVRPSMGLWHCFGCGRSGDVFGYVQERENLDFPDAVELLADKYHIELHREQGRGSDNARKGSKRTRLLEMNEEAQRFFVEQLTTQEALPARQLLGGRDFSREDCARFGCGYAPQGWDNLVRHLAGKGYTQQEMLDAGLARQGQRGIYDYFRGRATWPIRDSTGRTLGFGARKLYDDDQIGAKYINTPDTQLYHKNQVLYGIDLAKDAIVKKRQVVIVEGYTDVMAMHLAGIDTAVATCGTAFGEEHAKIVRRLIHDDSLGAVQLVGPLNVEGQALSSRIVFTFDGDAAGQKAALHAFGLDTAFLSQTFVAVAEDNLDPCDLRIQHGDDALRALVENAKPLYDFVLGAAVNRFDTSYTAGQMGAVKATAPLIAQIRDRSLWDLYARKEARAIGVDLDVMRREVIAARKALHVRDEDAYAPRRNRYPRAGEMERQSEPTVVQTRLIEQANAERQTFYRVPDPVFICEQQFMATLIQIPRAVNAELFRGLNVHCFQTPVFQTLYQAVDVAGGLPPDSSTQQQWFEHLLEAGGPMLGQVINELAVMPLPLRFDEGAVQREQDMHGGAGVVTQPLREATQSERQYANQLLAKLLDAGYMRTIEQTKHRIAQTQDSKRQIELLGVLQHLETARKELKASIFGG